MDKKLKKALDIIFPLVTFTVIAVIWQIAAKAIGVELVLPEPGKAFGRFFALWGESTFWLFIGSTLFRNLCSFFAAFFAAIVFAVLSYIFAWFYKAFNPLVMFIRAVPTMSVILICLIWLNRGFSTVLIAFLISFPVMYTGFYSALSRTDKKLAEMSALFRVSVKKKILKLYIPEILPNVFDTARSTIGLNLKVLIAAEVLAQTANSIGNMMKGASAALDMPSLFAWTVTAILLSFMLEGIVALIKRISLRYLYE